MRLEGLGDRIGTDNPGVWKAVGDLQKAIAAGGVDPKLLALVHLRASQINTCSACVHAGVAGGKKAGDTDERLHNVAAWREAPFYTHAERAALAPAEAATRLQDGAEGVTDEIWEEVNAHFTEEQLGAINLEIALTNFFNRINRTIKEPDGQTWR
ncbi:MULTISPECIES: carboxymuconolactone decarboxylase family protein [Streptomyces]|uniref:Carboxymuconolactone decarboxylase family protein n=1 Tax=Streptomyces koelreuteriae TaxID=2838015 RepID=A0ABX8G3C6_9ACTN|nr:MULTISPECIES: carboxymuconolactone decarboxylase family protein [Streptomyces]QWB27727.1 carboxymuconolactone decarboxylase family protein [Streptomyces koelreuteriae]UUA10829.1 carboxymuconolactone decarboxylase family protein [Streptomyces koelreuteriae]UUA18435.1 carboxymuconolactone decarboxylase family protein [Streptomyces sp. CRCS-T-1]